MYVGFFQGSPHEMARNCGLNPFTGIDAITLLSMSTLIILVKIGERSRGREVCKSELHENILAAACHVPVCLPFTVAWLRSSLQGGERGAEGLNTLNHQLSKIND